MCFSCQVKQNKIVEMKVITACLEYPWKTKYSQSLLIRHVILRKGCSPKISWQLPFDKAIKFHFSSPVRWKGTSDFFVCMANLAHSGFYFWNELTSVSMNGNCQLQLLYISHKSSKQLKFLATRWLAKGKSLRCPSRAFKLNWVNSWQIWQISFKCMAAESAQSANPHSSHFLPPLLVDAVVAFFFSRKTIRILPSDQGHQSVLGFGTWKSETQFCLQVNISKLWRPLNLTAIQLACTQFRANRLCWSERTPAIYLSVRHLIWRHSCGRRGSWSHFFLNHAVFSQDSTKIKKINQQDGQRSHCEPFLPEF